MCLEGQNFCRLFEKKETVWKIVFFANDKNLLSRKQLNSQILNEI